MKSKKAELTTKQIVILVVLILSFAIILFFLFRLNLGDESDKQLCYNSVVNKANPAFPVDTPLNCQRNYVCITQDGSCEDMIDPDKKKVKTEEEVYEVLAEELSDCWWVFGEGKIDYAGRETIPGLYCSICSQINFDDSVKKIFKSNEFDKRKFYEYMAKTKMQGSNGLTYTEYLFGTNDLNALSSQSNGNFGEVDLNFQYYSLIGAYSKVHFWSWALIGAGALPLVVFGAPLVATIIVGAAVAGGGYFLAPVITGASGNEYIPPSLIKVGSNEFTGLKCSEITTRS